MVCLGMYLHSLLQALSAGFNCKVHHWEIALYFFIWHCSPFHFLGSFFLEFWVSFVSRLLSFLALSYFLAHFSSLSSQVSITFFLAIFFCPQGQCLGQFLWQWVLWRALGAMAWWGQQTPMWETMGSWNAKMKELFVISEENPTDFQYNHMRYVGKEEKQIKWASIKLSAQHC